MLSLNTIFRFILLLLSIIGLNAQEGSSEISLQNIITDRKKYDEYIINRSVGLHEITGFKQNDSTVGIILVHGFYPLKIGEVRVLNGLNRLRIFLRLDCQCGYTGMIGINALQSHQNK